MGRDTGMERYILARLGAILEMRTRFNVPLAIPGPLFVVAFEREARLNRLVVDGIFPGRRIRRIPERAFVRSPPSVAETAAGLYLPGLSLFLSLVDSLSFFNFCRPFSFQTPLRYQRNSSPRATSQVSDIFPRRKGKCSAVVATNFSLLHAAPSNGPCN